MPDRYFVDEPISAGRVVLAGPEAHHLIHVMRAAPGLRVVLFDGSGAEFPAVVQKVGRSEVELSVLAREQVDRELPLHLTLAVALPKGDRQKWLVEKAVELGVTRIVPLRTERGVAQPLDQALVRLRRAVVEASKQCGRNRLLQIDEPRSWPELVATTAGVAFRVLAHPQAEKRMGATAGLSSSEPTKLHCWTSQQWHPTTGSYPSDTLHELPDRVLLAIGPEGGFTDEEVALAAAAGWRVVDLGPRILRVETAALLLAAMIVQQ